MILHHLTITGLFIATSITTAAAVPVVDTSLGRIIGITTDESVDAFLGIQFAQVGPRFSTSTLIDTPWTDPINATSFGPYCWQAIPPGGEETLSVYTQQPQDEECLYLNIWRPVANVTTNSSSSLLTTMVYVHGGGFNFGSAAEPIYNGANLARDHNVVVVSMNYRLGLFGFLVTGENGKGGLNGIHDQITALQWVQRHIQSFGGNPSNVTVFGESAGSMSVCMLCVSPLAKGLFHQSIQQSGECAVGLSIPNTPEVGAQNTATILESLNASSVNDLANATLYPAKDIAPFSTKSLIGWHTVDGWVLPKQPKELYSDSTNIIPTSMLIGSNSYDSPFLLSTSAIAFSSMAMNMETEIYGMFGPEYGAVVMQAYSPNLTYYGGNPVSAYAQFWGDFFFRCASRQFAALVADHLNEGSVYLYNYAHLSSVDIVVLNGLKELANLNDTTWASHAADVPMIFNTLDAFQKGWWSNGESNGTTDFGSTNEEDMALGNEMRARWISFAKMGNPNTDEFGGWSPVPQGENAAGSATSIPSFVLQSGGSNMTRVDKKVEQCNVFGFFSPPPANNNTTAATSSGVSGDNWIVGAFVWLVVVMILIVESFA